MFNKNSMATTFPCIHWHVQTTYWHVQAPRHQQLSCAVSMPIGHPCIVCNLFVALKRRLVRCQTNRQIRYCCGITVQPALPNQDVVNWFWLWRKKLWCWSRNFVGYWLTEYNVSFGLWYNSERWKHNQCVPHDELPDESAKTMNLGCTSCL